MFAVIFVVRPRSRNERTTTRAREITRPKLEAIDGFIDNERSPAQRIQAGSLLVDWRDEKAVIAGAPRPSTTSFRQRGRNEIFEDYAYAVGEIIPIPRCRPRDTRWMKTFRRNRNRRGESVTITEFIPKGDLTLSGRAGQHLPPMAWSTREVFESIYHPGKHLRLGFLDQPRSAKPGAHTRGRRPNLATGAPGSSVTTGCSTGGKPHNIIPTWRQSLTDIEPRAGGHAARGSEHAGLPIRRPTFPARAGPGGRRFVRQCQPLGRLAKDLEQTGGPIVNTSSAFAGQAGRHTGMPNASSSIRPPRPGSSA